MSLRPSVRSSVRPSVRPSVRSSFRPSVSLSHVIIERILWSFLKVNSHDDDVVVSDIQLRAKKTIFFNANLIAFLLGKTKKLNDQMKALEKIFKSRPIPLF